MWYVYSVVETKTKFMIAFLSQEPYIDKPGFKLTDYVGLSSEKAARSILLKWRSQFKKLNVEIDPSYVPLTSRSRK